MGNLMTSKEIKFIEEKASTTQREIWLARSLGTSTDYRIAYSYELSKDVEAKDVEKALGQLLEAHEILRTILVSDAEGLKQRIFRQSKPLLTWEKRGQATMEAAVGLKALSEEELSKEDACVHFYGFKDDNNKVNTIGLLADHCVADQETFEILRCDLETLLNNGRLDWEERLQFADYADWERRIEVQAAIEKNSRKSEEETRIKKDEEEEDSSIVLHSGQGNREEAGGRVTIQRILGEDRARQIGKLAATTGSTHYQIQLKLVQISLCRWRGMESCRVSTPISRRTQEEFSKVAGPLLRVESLKHQQHTNLSLQEHLQILQGDILSRISDDTDSTNIESAEKEKSDGTNQLREVFLTVEVSNQKEKKNRCGSEKQITVEGKPISLANKSAGILLISVLADEVEGLTIEAKYDPNSFKHEEIQSLLDDIECIGDALVAAPETPLWQVFWKLGAKEEKKQESANQQESARYADTASMTKLLQQLQWASSHHSEHVCVIDREFGGENERRFSYKDIWTAAEALGAELIRRGVKQGDYIGIVTGGLSTYVVSFIGSIRIGAVCVPLEKEQYALETEPARAYSSITHWIVSDDLINNREEGGKSSTKESEVASILEGKKTCHFEKELPRIESVRSAAYVMFTSGTTGKPKGVVIPAGGLLKLGDEFKERGWNTKSKVLCAANRGFDASTFEIWATILNGGTLVQGLKNEVINPDLLARLIDQYRITAAWLTKTVFDLVAQLKPEALMGLKDLIIGGEALSATVVERFLQRSKGRLHLWNGYGPTETTTFATVDALSLDPEGKLNPILLGREVAGNNLRILGPDLEQLPIGSVGEAYISGAGLACGYLNNARATATTFIPDPYSKIPGKRMYRTGDFFQIMAMGRYRYIGRRDKLVKIRGFRVSTSTIEEQLLQIKGVAEAIVTARQHNQGHQLIAFVKCNDKQDLTGIEIRSRLRGNLPDYMIPTVIKMIKEIPVTQNGKVDQQALMDSLLNEPANGSAEDDAPVTLGNNYTRILHEVWAEVLQKGQVPLAESVYVHGADSLSFIRCCILLGERGVSVTPQDLIAYATVVDQAAVVQRLASEQEATRSRVSSLTCYQECLNRLAAQNRTVSGVAYSSFSVDKEYDAVSVGMALFRIFSLHPTLDWNSYNPIFARSAETPIQPIGVVQMSEIESLEDLDQALLTTIADDLKRYHCPIRAYVAQGTDKNYVAIGVDNLVCGLASLGSISNKVASWLSMRKDNDWSWWHLFGEPLKNQQIELSRKKYSYEIMAKAYSQALTEIKNNTSAAYGEVFINTEGFHDITNEQLTQPARIIRIGNYADLIQKEELAIGEIIHTLLKQDNDKTFSEMREIPTEQPGGDSLRNTKESLRSLLIHTYRNEETRIITRFDWKSMLQLTAAPATISVCINHENVYYEVKEENNDTLPITEVERKPKKKDAKIKELIGVVSCLNDSNTKWSTCCISPLIDDISCYQGLAATTQGQISLSGIYIHRVEFPPDSDKYIKAIAKEIAQSLEAKVPNAILGYSLGGVIAAETCTLLQQRTGMAPKLIILDTLCPSTLRESGHDFPDYNIGSWMERVVQMRTAYISGEQTDSVLQNNINKLANPLEVLREMQRHGMIATAETLGSFNQYLQNGLRQYEAYRSYTPPPLQMPCLIARAEEQEEAIKKLLNATGKPEMLGWEKYLQEKVTTIELKGDHVSIIRGEDKGENNKLLTESILSFLESNGKH